MSAATADKVTTTREAYARRVTLATSAIIFAGCFVNYDASGNLVDGVDATSRRFAGIATESANEANGDTDCEVAYGPTRAYKVLATGLTAGTDEGKPVYLKDNQTVALAGATTYGIYVGRIVHVISATSAWIVLDPGGDLSGGVNRGTLYASNFAVSTLMTATGSAQNFAHGLGVVPTLVQISIRRGHNGAGAAGDKCPQVTEGTHTSTNAIFTLEAGSQFVVTAWK